MTEHKFTDEEVIKALAELEEMSDLTPPICYHEKGVTEPPFCRPFEQYQRYTKIALDLINRQRAEIAALVSAVDNSTKEFLKLHDDYQDQKAEIERLQWGEYRHIGKTVLNARNEGIEEFAERLKEQTADIILYGEIVPVARIDRLVKEMTESKPCTDGADCFAAEGKE